MFHAILALKESKRTWKAGLLKNYNLGILCNVQIVDIYTKSWLLNDS